MMEWLPAAIFCAVCRVLFPTDGIPFPDTISERPFLCGPVKPYEQAAADLPTAAAIDVIIYYAGQRMGKVSEPVLVCGPEAQ